MASDESAELGLPERQEGEGRKHGINISGDTVTQATAGYPEVQRAIVRRVYALAMEQGWSYEAAAAQTKVSSTTLYRVWTGTYRGESGEQVKLDGVCERLERFLGLWEARVPEARLPFIETSVWKRTAKLCQEALEMQAIAMLYGEPQIGKTACLREVSRRAGHGQAPYVLTPAGGGQQSLMRTIAEQCHISPQTSFEELRRRVGNYLDDSKLLLIDEVHECFTSMHKGSMLKCLGMLRQLQESSGCGLVLCGTNVWRHELERGEFAQALRQLCRRGIWTLQLEGVATQADLRLIAAHYRLGEPAGEAADLVRHIAHTAGLGKYCKFLHRAAALAAKRQQRMSWEHFVKVVAIAESLAAMPKSDWPAQANSRGANPNPCLRGRQANSELRTFN